MDASISGAFGAGFFLEKGFVVVENVRCKLLTAAIPFLRVSSPLHIGAPVSRLQNLAEGSRIAEWEGFLADNKSSKIFDDVSVKCATLAN